MSEFLSDYDLIIVVLLHVFNVLGSAAVVYGKRGQPAVEGLQESNRWAPNGVQEKT